MARGWYTISISNFFSTIEEDLYGGVFIKMLPAKFPENFAGLMERERREFKFLLKICIDILFNKTLFE